MIEVFDGVAVSTRGDAFITLWNAPARVPRIRWGFDVLDRQLSHCPNGVAILMILLPTADPPDGPARAENARMIKKYGSQVRATSTVILGDGIFQSLTRTVVRTMLFIAPKTQRTTISASVPEGIARVLDVATPATPAAGQFREDIRTMYLALGLAEPAPYAQTG